MNFDLHKISVSLSFIFLLIFSISMLLKQLNIPANGYSYISHSDNYDYSPVNANMIEF